MAILNEELMEKARGAKSAEELLALAKENDVELTEEQANAYFEQMNKTGELEDDELDSVAGGGCHKGDGRLVVSGLHFCNCYICEKCGGITDAIEAYFLNRDRLVCRCHAFFYSCFNCKHCSYEKGLWLCNEPRNRK